MKKISPDFSIVSFKGGYKEYLKESIGFDSFLPSPQKGGGKILFGPKKDFHGGTMSLSSVAYDYPQLDVEFQYAEHLKSTDTLVIVLHGHYSNMNNVMGLAEIDTMRRSGEYWFLKGFDVVAFNVTSDAITSSQLNSQLFLYGTQIYGLWARGISDLAKYFRKEKRYRKIILIGFSNGAVIADFVSVLSKDINIVIVDDILFNWRKLFHKNEHIWSVQNYSLYFLEPFAPETSYLDLILNSESKKYYTRSMERFKELLEIPAVQKYISSGINVNSKVNFVEKELPIHAIEISLIDKILVNELDSINGYHLK